MEETQREVIDTKTPHLDVEKAWEKARFLKQDLDKGDGWTQRYQIVNEYNSWTKTFPNEEVRVKLLYRFENMPMSAEKFIEMMSAEKMDLREQWDNTTGASVAREYRDHRAFVGFGGRDSDAEHMSVEISGLKQSNVLVVPVSSEIPDQA